MCKLRTETYADCLCVHVNKLQYTTHLSVNQDPQTSRCGLLANTGGSVCALPEAAFRTAARLLFVIGEALLLVNS